MDRWLESRDVERKESAHPTRVGKEKCSAHEGPVNLNVSQEGTRVAA